MNDLKYTCPMTCVCDFFRIYRELRIELLEHPKRRALKQPLEIYPLKLRGLWNLGDHYGHSIKLSKLIDDRYCMFFIIK